MIVGFDIISDLELTSQDTFDWEGKPTSLFCIIPGNVSADITVLYKTLKHLSLHYKGVFFIDGSLENPDPHFSEIRIKDLSKLNDRFNNVVYLHNNVVIVDGIALIGINGWEEKSTLNTSMDLFQIKANRYDDIMYLEKTVERLQLHVDVKKIVIVTNSIPTKELYFNSNAVDDVFPIEVVSLDTEDKLSKWVFGTSDKMVDTVINGVKFVNNPKHDKNPYYPKRIDIQV